MFTVALRGRALSAAVALSAGLCLTGAAAAQTEGALADDPRLDQKTTLKLQKAPLSEVTAALGRAAGVTLQVTPDTADEPALVHVTDQPAREVMRQLARHFGYRWSRSGQAGEYRYELYQDLNARQAEEALRRQDRVRALRALQADLPKRRELYRERPNPREEATLRMALALTPAHWDALASGRVLAFSTGQEAGAIPLPRAVAGEVLGLHQQERGNVVEGVRERFWLSYSLSEVRLRHMGTVSEARGPAGGFGGLVANAFSQSFTPRPPPTEEQVAAWQRDPVLGTRRPFGVDPARAAPGRRFAPGSPTFLHVYEILPVLAEAYGVDLVADAYRAQRFSRQPPAAPQEMALYEALNRFLEYAADWTRDGEFLRVRSVTWYYDRPAEIPARVVRHWSALLRRERALTLDNAAALALALRDEQWPHLEGVLRDEGVHLHARGMGRTRGFGEEGSREVLRAYAVLTPRQREGLRSGGQLAVAEMSPPARQWLLAAIDQGHRQLRAAAPPGPDLPPGVLTLSAVTVRREITSVEEGQVRWILRALDGPNAGKQIYSLSQGGTLAPGLAEGGQVLQQLAWRCNYGEAGALALDLALPWVYIDPSVKVPDGPEPAETAPKP
jgi:hypothetical protein